MEKESKENGQSKETEKDKGNSSPEEVGGSQHLEAKQLVFTIARKVICLFVYKLFICRRDGEINKRQKHFVLWSTFQMATIGVGQT